MGVIQSDRRLGMWAEDASFHHYPSQYVVVKEAAERVLLDG